MSAEKTHDQHQTVGRSAGLSREPNARRPGCDEAIRPCPCVGGGCRHERVALVKQTFLSFYLDRGSPARILQTAMAVLERGISAEFFRRGAFGCCGRSG